MRRLAAVALLPCLTLLAAADEPKAKRPALTPQEAADGWLILFDGESLTGWRPLNDSKWTVYDGMLAPQGNKPVVLLSTTPFADFEAEVEYRTRAGTKSYFLINCDAQGRSRAVGDKPRDGKDDGEKKDAPKIEFPLSPELMHMGNSWGRMRVKVVGGRPIDTRYESGGAASVPPPAPLAPETRPAETGFVALSGTGFVVRSVKLRPLANKSLFTGKDLAGWKAFDADPKKGKSKFGVSKEGWLTIKDGPGDLATEGQWADFVLQVQCKTNGKHLNSGVFFRCRPGEYQQGYEAQIHNGWLDKPKKYAVEVFDPQTHELKEKKEVESRAMDYGTGAIYRRVPATKEVARDGEWFTLTVAAHGNHIATWVDGVQVMDWYDNRPVKDNARNGCKLDKGPISLQGHDPTTDLSFSNFRLAELPPMKEK
jgi:hypothetical protein